MKKTIISLSLLLAAGTFVACNNDNDKEQQQQQQQDGKTDTDSHSDAKSDDGRSDAESDDGRSDADTEIDENWCDASYNQHCDENGNVVWCDVDEGEVVRMSCSGDRVCMEVKDQSQNMADCVTSCTAGSEDIKACGAGTEAGVTILATAQCLETVQGGYGLFTTKRESCSFCQDLNCHVSADDAGADLEPGDDCLSTFVERCEGTNMLYCDNGSVEKYDCASSLGKICVKSAEKNLAFCAAADSKGCEVGSTDKYCSENFGQMAVTKICARVVTGDTYINETTISCANGCNNGECDNDIWR